MKSKTQEFRVKFKVDVSYWHAATEVERMCSDLNELIAKYNLLIDYLSKREGCRNENKWREEDIRYNFNVECYKCCELDGEVNIGQEYKEEVNEKRN